MISINSGVFGIVILSEYLIASSSPTIIEWSIKLSEHYKNVQFYLAELFQSIYKIFE